MKFKNVIKAITFICIIVLLLGITDRWLKNEEDKPRFLVQDSSGNRIINETRDTMDVIFVGDSIMQAGISPYEIWENYGIPSYICGSSGQYMYESYDYLEKMFEYQSPSVVVLEVDELHRFSTIEQYTLLKLADNFNIINSHNGWKDKLSSIETTSDIKSYDYSFQDVYDNMKGYVYQPQVVPAEGNPDYMNNNTALTPICITNRVALREIKKLCEDNNAKLVLLGIPSMENSTYGKRAAIVALANELQLDFVDYNVGELKEQLALDWSTDSRDGGDHLSQSGTVKVSKLFGAYLSQTYSLPDRRNDSAYQKWNDELSNYHSIVGYN